MLASQVPSASKSEIVIVDQKESIEDITLQATVKIRDYNGNEWQSEIPHISRIAICASKTLCGGISSLFLRSLFLLLIYYANKITKIDFFSFLPSTSTVVLK